MNDDCKFFVGQKFEYGGVLYRVRRGNRCDGDMILEFSISGWHRPAIAHTMILAAFKFQVEENNYGPDGKVKPGAGGFYFLDKIKRACLNGWRSEADKIVKQREELQMRNGLAQPEIDWDSVVGIEIKMLQEGR